jgi:Na+/melibiose symporter-like transporter
MSQAPPLRKFTKIAFGIGASGEAIAVVSFNLFVFFYYNQVLGLSGTLAGLAVTIALVSDAITDPIMGTLSDRFKSRLGRRHPFLLFTAIPLGIAFFLIFSPPPGLEGFSLFAWFTGFTILMRALLTLYAVPHLALGAELSTDYHQRSTVMAYNNLFGFVGGAAISWIGYSYFFDASEAYPNGLLNPGAYPVFALFAAIMISITILGCAWFTRDRIPFLPQPPEDQPPFHPIAVFKEMFSAISNRNYLNLLLGFFLLSLMLGVHETLVLHMGTFFWELGPSQLRFYIFGSITGYILGFTTTTPFHRRFDKRNTIICSVVGLAFFGALAVNLRLLGLFPENGHAYLLAILIFISVFSYASGSILNISVMSALADIADEHELSTGRRQEGIFYSARTFFAKSTSAVGHLIGGVALDVIQFPTKAVPGEVLPETVFALGMVYGPLAMIPGLASMLFYRRYKINRYRLLEIQKTLMARKDDAVRKDQTLDTS